MEPIILASGSLRRQDFFKLLGLPFSIKPSEIDETITGHLKPRTQAEYFAKKKVEAVIASHDSGHLKWVFGADTIITINGKVYGKAEDRQSAKCMLKVLSGRNHEVITAIALYSPRTQRIDCCSNRSIVHFATISEEEIDWYLDSGEWQGVAGAYRIQGVAACFITRITGSYSSIVGLPLHDFYVMLRRNAYPLMG